MITDAITKLKTEMEQSKSNTYIQIVGTFLVNYLNANPEQAEKISNPDKTIAKSLNEMSKEAAKKKVGNCAVLTDQEGFEIVLKYFDIDTNIIKNVTEPAQNVIKPPESVTKNIEFDIKLEDLI